MAFRLAIDLDGVLADMESELVRQAKSLFGESVIGRLGQPASDPPLDGSDLPSPESGSEEQHLAAESSDDSTPPVLRVNLSARQQRRLWKHVETIDNFWQSLTEIEPGIIARLSAAAAERRWEIIFLTKRPQTSGATAQLQSQRWLESKGFALASVYVVHGSRGKIADALGIDVVIDDRPENCLDVVADSKARAILVWRDREKTLPAAARRLGIGVVASMQECLDVLTRVDADPSQPGVLNRLRRLLGLREPSRL